MASSILGFFSYAIIFVSFELAVEQTAPDGVGESMSCGLINSVAQTFAFVLDVSITPLLTAQTHRSGGIIFAILSVLLILALLFLLLASIYTSKKARKVY